MTKPMGQQQSYFEEYQKEKLTGTRINGDAREKGSVYALYALYDRGREVYSRPGKFLMI